MARGEALIKVMVFAARLIVGGSFVYAGCLKSVSVAQFIRDIWSFRLLPDGWAFWIAAYLPFLEIIAGVALITGLQRRGAHVVLAGLLATFSILLGSAWARGLQVSCGCFGATQLDSSLAWAIARDLLLLGGLLVSVWASRPICTPAHKD
jgi:putative oxidoreductase